MCQKASICNRISAMKRLLGSIILGLVFTVIANPVKVSAATPDTTASINHSSFKLAITAQQCKDRGGIRTSGVFGQDNCVGSDNQNPIFSMLSIFLRFFMGALGIAMVAVLVYAGIRYIVSAGSPDEVKGAKNMIKAVLTALVLFVIMNAILEIVIPGNLRLFR